jgi:hypothetical protein
MAEHSALYREIYSPIFENSTPMSYSTFTHHILDVYRAQFAKDFRSTEVHSVKKVGNSGNQLALLSTVGNIVAQ